MNLAPRRQHDVDPPGQLWTCSANSTATAENNVTCAINRTSSITCALEITCECWTVRAPLALERSASVDFLTFNVVTRQLLKVQVLNAGYAIQCDLFSSTAAIVTLARYHEQEITGN